MARFHIRITDPATDPSHHPGSPTQVTDSVTRPGTDTAPSGHRHSHHQVTDPGHIPRSSTQSTLPGSTSRSPSSPPPTSDHAESLSERYQGPRGRHCRQPDARRRRLRPLRHPRSADRRAARSRAPKGLTVHLATTPASTASASAMLLQTRQIRKMISSTSARTRSSSASTSPANSNSNSTRRARWPSACAPAAPASRRSSRAPATARSSPRARRSREFDGQHYVMETALKADVALVKAWKADHAGNLVFRKTARNFNPVCAMAGKFSVAEVEELVEIGDDRSRPCPPAGHLRRPHRAQPDTRKAHRTAHRS